MAIYFLTPDYTFPSGGVRVIYRHVDILNRNGISAYVLHEKPGFRCTWLDNNTRVAWLDRSLKRRLFFKAREAFQKGPRELFLIGGDSNILRPEDMLVVHEMLGPKTVELAPGIPKVILNQGCYLTFQGYPMDKTAMQTPYGNEEIKAVLINSAHGKEYLEYVFPSLPVKRFHLSIDPSLYWYQKTKKRQICFSPRKNEFLIRQVINILKFRNVLGDFELLPFSGKTVEEVAQIYQESAIFISVAQYEGFGLLPAEAMACGCLVVGFDAGGGREFFRPEFSFPVEQGDILGLANTVERLIKTYDSDAARYDEMRRAASKFIHAEYSPEREERELVEIWRGLLEQQYPSAPSLTNLNP